MCLNIFLPLVPYPFPNLYRCLNIFTLVDYLFPNLFPTLDIFCLSPLTLFQTFHFYFSFVPFLFPNIFPFLNIFLPVLTYFLTLIFFSPYLTYFLPLASSLNTFPLPLIFFSLPLARQPHLTFPPSSLTLTLYPSLRPSPQPHTPYPRRPTPTCSPLPHPAPLPSLPDLPSARRVLSGEVSSRVQGKGH